MPGPRGLRPGFSFRGYRQRKLPHRKPPWVVFDAWKFVPITHVSDEDLELYFLGRLPSEQISTIESHLTDCSSCTDRLSNVTGLFLKMLTLNNRRIGNYEGIEKRRE